MIPILCVGDSYCISWVNVDKGKENVCMALFNWCYLYQYYQIGHTYLLQKFT
jgi:hypothetical protein